MKNETIILAGGCFWCTEAVFKSLKGVIEVIPGYSEGAESVKIVFDPKIITINDLLDVFFKLHDPTTLNRQGADVGPQYRSAVFYFNNDQKLLAETEKSKIKNAVTQISPYKNFFPAEEYHREYYSKNKGNMYCNLVIDPKIQKLKQDFNALLNNNSALH